MKGNRKLVPLLLLYVLVVFLIAPEHLRGDEEHYVRSASNLTNGFYSPQDDINLWFGPGYPIVLVPFVLLKLPLLAARLLNALFLFAAMVYFYHGLRLYVGERSALCFSYALGIYLPFLRHIHLLLTETLVILLVCGFLFHFCRLHISDRHFWTDLAIGSFCLGYLALTKVFFGYVIVSGLLLFLVLYLWSRDSATTRTVVTFCLALVLCLPYLFYTYSLTGKFFYWGNSGGLSLYWMSSPYQTDLGDWHSPDSVANIPELAHNHGEFFREIEQLPSIERDDALVGQALRNIARNPVKYITNWMANVGRLLFNYPYSHTQQKLSTFFYLVPNAFLVVIAVLSVYPAYLGRKSVPYELWALGVFALISFGGSSLLSAYGRQLVPLVPVLVLWIAFTWIRIVEVRLRY